MAPTVTIGEQKVCPESESLKFSATPTPQVENPSDSTTPTPQPWMPYSAAARLTNTAPGLFLAGKLSSVSCGSRVTWSAVDLPCWDSPPAPVGAMGR